MEDLALLLAALLIIVSAFFWQRAVYGAFFLVVVDGALRKWFFPGLSDLIYFIRDIVLIGAYIGFFLRPPFKRRTIKLSFTLRVCFLFTFLWSCFMIFAPGVGSPLVGVFGLRNYFVYVPLLWVLPTLFEEKTSFQNFLKVYILASIPVVVLSIVQFFLPPSSILNVYTPTDAISGVATFGSDNQFVRVTGTFSYLTSYGNYLLFCTALLLPIFTSSIFRGKPRLFNYAILVSLALITVSSLMTGSRGLVFPLVFMGLSYFLFDQLLIEKYSLPKFLSKRLVPVLFALVVSFSLIGSAADAFLFRLNNAGGSQGDLPWRIAQIVNQPIEFSAYNDLDGFGIGTTHQATSVLRRRFNLPAGQPINVYFESEPGRIMLELGPIGFVLWYSLRLLLLMELYRTFRKLEVPLYKKLALSAFLFHAIQIYGLLVFSPVASFFYWVTASFITVLPQLEASETTQFISYSYAPTEL